MARRRQQAPRIDGILNIDKPYGITSMDVVRRVKRASGQRRVGHGGTLDPIATGVIPVCMGQATRLMEDVVGGAKTYLAGVELGVSTNTYDALGEVTGRRDASGVTLTDIEGALPAFTGDILQVPPMYSALKREGKRLYDLARAGVEVEREARPVTVHSIALREWAPPVVTLEVECGKGVLCAVAGARPGEGAGVRRAHEDAGAAAKRGVPGGGRADAGRGGGAVRGRELARCGALAGCGAARLARHRRG